MAGLFTRAFHHFWKKYANSLSACSYGDIFLASNKSNKIGCRVRVACKIGVVVWWDWFSVLFWLYILHSLWKILKTAVAFLRKPLGFPFISVHFVNDQQDFWGPSWYATQTWRYSQKINEGESLARHFLLTLEEFNGIRLCLTSLLIILDRMLARSIILDIGNSSIAHVIQAHLSVWCDESSQNRNAYWNHIFRVF